MHNRKRFGAALSLGWVVLLLATGCTTQSQPAAPPQVATQPTTAPAAAPPNTPTTASSASPAAAAASPATASPSAAPKPAAAASPSPASTAGRWNFDSDAAGGVPAGAQVFS